MKKQLTLIATLLLATTSTFAQVTQGYKFEPIYDIDATPVKDQHRSGTCWAFAGLSFLESEILRTTKKSFDLSQMFVVRNCYSDKAIKYVRMHGSLNFGAGGAFHDVIYVLKNYGITPENIYSGLEYGENKHIHGEIDATIKNYLDAVIKNPNKKLTTAWLKGVEGILDAYFGKIPENFTIDNKKYSPQSFAKDILKINPDDYIQLTSYTHHPFYSKFIIEIPDNWLWETVYNLPLDELMEVMFNALKTGYTIGWATDVSEKGFSFKNGLAIIPETEITEMSDSERSKWEELSKEDQEKLLYSFDEPRTEKKITQQIRQEAFDNYLTTDDHGMHITGLAKDQNGTIYFKTKNSWNTTNIFDGYLYASETYVRYKTMSIMVHKNAIPKDIQKKLKLQ